MPYVEQGYSTSAGSLNLEALDCVTSKVPRVVYEVGISDVMPCINRDRLTFMA